MGDISGGSQHRCRCLSDTLIGGEGESGQDGEKDHDVKLTSFVWSHPSVCSGGMVFFRLGGSLHGLCPGVNDPSMLLFPHQPADGLLTGVSLTAVLHRTPNRPGEREREISDDGRTLSSSSRDLGAGGEDVSFWSPKVDGEDVGRSVPAMEGGTTGDAVGVGSLDVAMESRNLVQLG